MTVHSILDAITQVGIAVFNAHTRVRVCANDRYTLLEGLLPADVDPMVEGCRHVILHDGSKLRICTTRDKQDATLVVVLECADDTPVGFQRMVDAMDTGTDGFWQWHVKDGKEFLSPRFWDTLGYGTANRQHRPESWMKVIHPDDLPGVMANLKAHIESHGAVPYYNTVRYTHREGHDVWIVCRGAVTQWDGAKPSLMMGTHTDVTKLLRAGPTEEQERDLRERKAMVNYVFHEVRNPISTLSTGLELLRQEIKAGAPPDTLMELTKTMTRAVSRSVHVLNDTLAFSKLENGRFSLDLAEHNLVNITNDVVAEFETEANDGGIQLLTQFFCRRAVIVCDQLRVRQILNNLLSNALKFTPSGGTITVTIRMSDDEVRLSVKDTGSGIPADKLDAIWEPYSQVEDGHRHNMSMGLGLTICRILVTAHHGSLTVASEVGAGTEFTLTLPRIQIDTLCEKVKAYTSRTQSSSSDEEDGGIQFRGARVLVVEDDPINRTMLVRLLEGRGITATSAKDGRQFLDAVSRGALADVDLVLLDELMPRMNGTVALRVARQEFGFAKPVVFLTGCDLEEHRAAFKAVGASGILTKPVNTVALFATLAKYMMDKTVEPAGGGM